MRSAAPHPPSKERAKQRPGPTKPSRLTSISRTSSSEQNDGIKLLERDLQIITKKLTDLKKVSVDDNSTNRNVIGLSNSTPILTNEETIKLQLTEQIMTKLTEVDREVLTKTGDTLISRARRSSRDSLLGSDLSCMPAHLTLIDRVMDFHVLIKRNEASSFNSNSTTSSSSSKQNSRATTPNDTQEDVSKYKQLIKEKDQEIAKLKSQLEGCDSEMKKCTSQLKAKDDEIKSKQTKHTNSLEELKNKQKLLLEEQKKKMTSTQEEMKEQKKAVVQLQKELQTATAITSGRSPEDTRYITELEEKVQQQSESKGLPADTDTLQRAETLQHQNDFLMMYLEKAIEVLGSDDDAPTCSTTPDDVILIIESVNNQSNDTKSLMTTLFGMIQTLKSQLAESTSLSRNYEAKIKVLVKKQKEEINHERVTCTAVVKGLEDQLLRKKDEMNKVYLEMKAQKSQLTAVIDKNTITQQYEEDSSLIKKLQKLLNEANEHIHVLTQEQQTLTAQVAEFRQAFLHADEKCRDAEFLSRVLTEEAARAKEANDDLRKKMSDLTQTYLS